MDTAATTPHAPGRKIVIIGGVAAGMSAAARLRRLDEHASIIVIERSGNVSYANCGLPYHVGGVIPERSSLLLQTPQALEARFAIEARVRTEVTSINRDAQTVTTKNLETGAEEELSYDALVLAPGARPVRPPIPGIERALSLRNVEDTDAMVAAVPDAKTATVIGGGFIGVEVAENLIHRGLHVILVEATPQLLAPLDPEMVAPVHQAVRDAGVDLRLGTSVEAISDDGVRLSTGETVPADLVVAAIGVEPDTGLAQDAGLKTGPRGAIVVDAQLRTSDPAVYAAGDAVLKRDAVTDEPMLLPLAGPANRQGRRIADAICGRDVTDAPVLGTAIVKVFDLQVAATGWNEKRVRAAERPARIIHTHPVSHAGYYPGAAPMALKLLVDPETDLILGAQAVGTDGADKRIDVLATAMRAGMRAADLTELDLAYAPPYGSAKDPVNLLGYVDENLVTGFEQNIQWHEVTAAQNAGATVIDVRTPAEHASGAIPGAVNIPVDELRDRMDEVPAGDLIVHCAVGIRSHTAACQLTAAGRSVKNLSGGFKTWSAGQASLV